MTQPATGAGAREVLDAEDVQRALTRIAHEILERNKGADSLVLMGIPTRGVPLATRLAERIAQVEGSAVPVGSLDVTMFRDDLRMRPARGIGRTELPSSLGTTGIDGATVVLVDDVLYSGRTIRAALDALSELGRPRSVQLAVLSRPRAPGAPHPGRLRREEPPNVTARDRQGHVGRSRWLRRGVHRRPAMNRHLLSAGDLSKSDALLILDTAAELGQLADRPVKKLPTLRGRTVVNLFFEDSTRTRISFEAAAKRLSADVINFSAKGSSVSKGESLKDTALTLEAMGADAVVIRHQASGAPTHTGELRLDRRVGSQRR